MKAGSDLDELVSKNVFGKTKAQAGWLLNYSTDIRAAAEVKEQIDKDGHGWILVRKTKEKRYMAILQDVQDPDWKVVGETEAHAICLAALKALGVETNG